MAVFSARPAAERVLALNSIDFRGAALSTFQPCWRGGVLGVALSPASNEAYREIHHLSSITPTWSSAGELGFEVAERRVIAGATLTGEVSACLPQKIPVAATFGALLETQKNAI